MTCVTDNSDNVSYTSVLLLIESKRIAEVNAGTAKMVKTTIRIFLSDILQIYIYIYIFTVYFWRLRTLLYSTVLYFNAPEVFYVLIVDSSSVNKRRLILSIYDIWEDDFVRVFRQEGPKLCWLTSGFRVVRRADETPNWESCSSETPVSLSITTLRAYIRTYRSEYQTSRWCHFVYIACFVLLRSRADAGPDESNNGTIHASKLLMSVLT